MKKASAGVRLDSLARGDFFRTRITLRNGVMLDRAWGGGAGARIQFEDTGDEKTVHPGCLVDRINLDGELQ